MDVQSTEAQVEEIQQIEEVTEETQENVTGEVAETQKAEEVKKEEKEPKWYEERIKRFTKQKYELQSENERLREELKKFKSETAEPSVPVPSQYVDEYGSFDNTRYQKDMTDYMNRFNEHKKTKEEALTMEEQYKKRLDERIDVYRSQVEALIPENPDLIEKLDKLKVTKPLELAIYESDESGKLALYLANNEAEVQKLNSMPVPKMLEYIGMIEGKLSVLTKKTSNATEPIIPLAGTKGDVDKPEEKMTDQEWADWRKKQRQKRGT